jgi:hypothetical protein
MDTNAAVNLAEAHALLYNRRHVWQEDENVPRCPQKCIVFRTICVCELIFGHEGPCERIQTWRTAKAERWLKQYPNFVDG